MSLSKTLQSPEIISSIKGKTFEEIMDILRIRGRRYYAENPQETETIKNNLISFGLPFDTDILKNVQEHIIYHYAEKILPLAGTPGQLADFVEKRVDFQQAKDMVSNALQKGSVLIAVSHFGGIELIVSSLSFLKFPINPVLKFSTQSLSDSLHDFAIQMEKSSLFAQVL